MMNERFDWDFWKIIIIKNNGDNTWMSYIHFRWNLTPLGFNTPETQLITFLVWKCVRLQLVQDISLTTNYNSISSSILSDLSIS